MANLFKLVSGFFQRPEITCILTYDMSPDILFRLDDAALGRLLAFFGWVFRSIPEVKKFLYKHRSSLSKDDLLHFIFHICLTGDRTLRNLNMIAFGMYDNTVEDTRARLVKEPWVKGIFFCPSNLEKTYMDLLKGFDNYITVIREHRELTEKFWMQFDSITLGPSRPYPYDPMEPINQATQLMADEGCLVIVAAGNEGGIVSGNSLNPWSLAPWVVCVGATNAEGTQLLPRSSRGSPDAPDVCPTVIAPGTVETWTHALGHNHTVAIENIKRSPPNSLVNIYTPLGPFIYHKDANHRISLECYDKQGNLRELTLKEVESFVKQAGGIDQQVSGTSIATEYIAAICNLIARKLHELGCNIPKPERPKLVKAILQDMAQPLENVERWKQGSGLVTIDIAQQHLQRLKLNTIPPIEKR